MQNYPVEDWLATDALFSDYDLSAISALAHQLQPQKVRSDTIRLSMTFLILLLLEMMMHYLKLALYTFEVFFSFFIFYYTGFSALQRLTRWKPPTLSLGMAHPSVLKRLTTLLSRYPPTQLMFAFFSLQCDSDSCPLQRFQITF